MCPPIRKQTANCQYDFQSLSARPVSSDISTDGSADSTSTTDASTRRSIDLSPRAASAPGLPAIFHNSHASSASPSDALTPAMPKGIKNARQTNAT